MTKAYGPIGADFANTATTATFTVGERACGADGTEWVYVQAAEAINQYDFVAIDENYQASQLTATEAGDGWMIGVAQVAFSNDDYGWVAVKGSNINGNAKAQCAADVALRTTGTAGYLDDATSGTKIDGVVLVSAIGTADSNAEVILTHPRSNTF